MNATCITGMGSTGSFSYPQAVYWVTEVAFAKSYDPVREVLVTYGGVGLSLS